MACARSAASRPCCVDGTKVTVGAWFVHFSDDRASRCGAGRPPPAPMRRRIIVGRAVMTRCASMLGRARPFQPSPLRTGLNADRVKGVFASHGGMPSRPPCHEQPLVAATLFSSSSGSFRHITGPRGAAGGFFRRRRGVPCGVCHPDTAMRNARPVSTLPPRGSMAIVAATGTRWGPWSEPVRSAGRGSRPRWCRSSSKRSPAAAQPAIRGGGLTIDRVALR